MPGPIMWPERKRFAFTIFDDTDLETIANGPASMPSSPGSVCA